MAATRVRDPISEVQQFLAMRNKAFLSGTSQSEMRRLEESSDVIKTDDLAGWRGFYKTATDTAMRIATDLDDRTEDVAVDGPKGSKTISLSKVFFKNKSAIEQSDVNAINYVINERVPKQKADQILPAIDKIVDELDFKIERQGGMIRATMIWGAGKGPEMAANRYFQAWQDQAVEGAVARIENNRQRAMEKLKPVFEQIGTERFKILRPESDGYFQITNIPKTREVKFPAFIQSFWNTFRSAFSLIFLGTMIAVPLGLKRTDIILWMVPLFFVGGLMYTASLSAKERHKATASLERDLKKEIRTAMVSGTDNAQKHIQAVLRKLAASNKQAFLETVIDAEEAIDDFEGAVSRATPARETTSDPYVTEKRVLLAKLKDKILPAFQRRLGELGW